MGRNTSLSAASERCSRARRGDVDEPAAPFDRWLLGVATNGKRWVAVGEQNAIFSSQDGVAWTRRTPVKTVVLHDVLWDGARFVAVGSDGAVLTSSDGDAWTEQAPMYYTLNAIAWNGKGYVGVGGEAARVIFSSPDLNAWTIRFSQTGGGLQDVALERLGVPRRRGQRRRALERRWSVVAAGGHGHAANALQRRLERVSFHGRGDRRRARRERGRRCLDRPWTPALPTTSTACAGPAGGSWRSDGPERSCATPAARSAASWLPPRVRPRAPHAAQGRSR